MHHFYLSLFYFCQSFAGICLLHQDKLNQIDLQGNLHFLCLIIRFLIDFFSVVEYSLVLRNLSHYCTLYLFTLAWTNANIRKIQKPQSSFSLSLLAKRQKHKYRKILSGYTFCCTFICVIRNCILNIFFAFFLFNNT